MLLGTMCMPPTQGDFGNQSETRKWHTITRRQSIKCHHPIPNTRVRAVQRPQIQAVDANCAHVAPNYVGCTCGATRAYAFDQVDKGPMRVVVDLSQEATRGTMGKTRSANVLKGINPAVGVCSQTLEIRRKNNKVISQISLSIYSIIHFKIHRKVKGQCNVW